VDLPSGVGDDAGEAVFGADVSYATGIAKTPLFAHGSRSFGSRVRYLDIGFFDACTDAHGSAEKILLPSVLDEMRALRTSHSDKRTYGHLFVVAGSRTMPGAALMAAHAAIMSGVGLVTAFVPESVCGFYSSVLPEAMWVPWPESAEGGLSLSGFDLLLSRIGRATGILAGPGMGDGEETQALLSRVVGETMLPLVLDADALRPEVLSAPREAEAGRIVVTPHAGEFRRIAERGDSEIEADELLSFSRSRGCITVLKGPITRITDGSEMLLSPYGGPVLARGGSGDLLSGLLGGRVAIPGANPLNAACEAVVLHGMAADSLARRRGSAAVRTTDLLRELSSVLRDE
jgi:NAD(P)H-hydrate epimerase